MGRGRRAGGVRDPRRERWQHDGRELADGWLQENPRVRAFHQPRNLGIAAAYERALDEAKLDRFSFLAGDGEIDRGSVRDILAAVGRADIVAPYPEPAGAPAPPPLPDLGLHRAGERAVRAPDALLPGPCIYPIALARALPKTEGGFYFLTQMLIHALHAGHSSVEVGLTHVERAHGRSKAVSITNILKALRTIAGVVGDLRQARVRGAGSLRWRATEDGAGHRRRRVCRRRAGAEAPGPGFGSA